MGNLRRVLILVTLSIVATACDAQDRVASRPVIATSSRSVTAGAASRTASTPPAVLDAARRTGSWDGDPHPQAPVQWVLTTSHAAASITHGETPSDDAIYMVQIQGHFPTCTPCTGLVP